MLEDCMVQINIALELWECSWKMGSDWFLFPCRILGLFGPDIVKGPRGTSSTK